MMADSNRIVIIGAGIAGAATAYFLTRKGLSNIVVLERESIAGAVSTGRNAAILRSAVPDPTLRELGLTAAQFYRHPPAGFAPQPLLRQVGVYLVAGSEAARDLLSWATAAGGAALSALDPAEVYRRVPILAPGITAAVCEPAEGVLDIHAILQAFLQGACSAGAELRLNCEAKGLRNSGGRIAGVETAARYLSAEAVVMAGGGWAASLAQAAGYPLPLLPYRRHLLVTDPLPQVDTGWPVVWCQGDEFYFRPESGGLLMCACDTEPVKPEDGHKTDPAEIERIAAKAARWLPLLGHAGVARAWAGMRTFAPDHRFVLGPDPRVRGLYWAAGLGGHGMTAGPAAGEIVAEWIIDGTSRHPAARAQLPERLL